MVSFFGIWIVPSSGSSSPVIRRKSVVLPDPFGPTRPTVAPGLSWSDASTKRICLPYCLLMPVSEIMQTLSVALTATIYKFDIDLADSDRGVYESIAVQAGRGSSTPEGRGQRPPHPD